MMDDFPLMVSTLYQRAVDTYPNQEIVSVESDLSVKRATYGQTDARIRLLAGALAGELGIGVGEPVGTFAWNNLRHHELYWATANTGRVCHTLNIRLFAEQLVYIVNHGGDRAIFVDPDLVGVLEPLADRFETVEAFIVMGDDASATSLPGAIAYEDLLARATPVDAWPVLDERSPMMYCYSSGTTGNPKGVAYTQRSTYLHTINNLANFPIESTDNILPIVPMFHAAAWGYPFMATTVGAKLTYPGPDLTPPGLVKIFHDEQVTFSAGVPTVWLGIQQHLMDHPEADIDSIRALLAGGAAVPRALIDWFWKDQHIELIQGWGMTETNPVAAVAYMTPELHERSFDDQLQYRETAGLLVPGLEAKIVDADGNELPHDGEAFGELLIRGPWIAAEYLRDPRTAESFDDGWLRTGDVCSIEPEGYIRITDRAKDVIKSGGEWISSLDLERHLMAHEAVAEAAVIGVKHVRWQERPLAVIVTRPGVEVTPEELDEHLRGTVADWWLPDEYRFADEIPKTGTGKLDKKVVRDEYADLLLE
jgi:fatty-acyl-CoA synthase